MFSKKKKNLWIRLALGIGLAGVFASTAEFTATASATGWVFQSGKWKYYRANLDLQFGWLHTGNEWYYLDDRNGEMRTGWLLAPDGKWYFLDVEEGQNNGKMLKGWQWIDGYCYYFDPISGHMFADEKTPDGYAVNTDGRCLLSDGKILFEEGKGVRTIPQKITEQKQSGQTSRAKGGGSSGGSSSGRGSSFGGSSSGRTSSGRGNSSASGSSSGRGAVSDTLSSGQAASSPHLSDGKTTADTATNHTESATPSEAKTVPAPDGENADTSKQVPLLPKEADDTTSDTGAKDSLSSGTQEREDTEENTSPNGNNSSDANDGNSSNANGGDSSDTNGNSSDTNGNSSDTDGNDSPVESEDNLIKKDPEHADKFKEELENGQNDNITHYTDENHQERSIIWVQGITPLTMGEGKDFQKAITHTSNGTYIDYTTEQKMNSSWFDTNKAYVGSSESARDRNLCFAATASNMLHWWMEQNRENIERFSEQNGEIQRKIKAETISLSSLIDSYHNQQSSGFFEMFKKIYGFRQDGFNTDVLIDLFINGYTPKPYGGLNLENENLIPDSGGGYFYEVFKGKKLTNRSYRGMYADLSQYLKEELLQGNILGIEHSVLGNNHIVTLWGAEYDAGGNLVAIYVTDSDDQNEEHVAMKRYLVNNANGIAKLTTNVTDKKTGSAVHMLHSLSLGQEGWDRYFQNGFGK